MKRLGLSAESVKQAFANARVNLADYKERIYQPLYDYQEFETATGPVPSTKFFQVPIGQTLAGSPRSLNDTNMDLAGQLPKGQAFLITGVSVEILPDAPLNSTVPAGFTQTVYSIAREGYLVLRIGSKEYIREGNLMKFPPKNRLFVDSSISVDPTATTTQVTQYGQTTGMQFQIVPLLLESNQNFEVTINDVVGGPSIPISNCRIGVTLDGYIYRNAQ